MHRVLTRSTTFAGFTITSSKTLTYVDSCLLHRPRSYSTLFNAFSSSNWAGLGQYRIRNNVGKADPDPSLQRKEEDEDDDEDQSPQFLQLGNSAILPACLVGLLTGVAVVLFNYTVHEIRELCWGEIPERGASWLREQSIESKWERVILVPAFGGLIVSLLNMIRSSLDGSTDGSAISNIKSALKPILKTVAACITLGTGNSLGPEGPSVEIGVSIAKAMGNILDKRAQRKLSLRASGSAAGISSELPLYLLLGALCGLVSLGLTKSTSFMMAFFDGIERTVGIPKAVLPILGGFAVGFIALAYPEILYWGFQNVDTLLESQSFAKSLSADLLVQLVAVKIIATSLCRASGLVGGYYAPSLFIGAGTGMAYGKIVGHLISVSSPMFHLSILEVASPQAYALVGMAATLAGVCQVPLTAVLLLFELTQDYRIVLPLLGAVGFSAWITSDKKTRRRAINNNATEPKDGGVARATAPENSTSPDFKEPNGSSLCELESSLCLSDSDEELTDDFADTILVSQAMRTRFVTTLMSKCLTDVVSLMLEEKQSCAVVVDDNDWFIGQLTLADIQQFIELPMANNRKPQVIRVSEVLSWSGKRSGVSWTATPNMSVLTALSLMNRCSLRQLPVIVLEEEDKDHRGRPVGVVDRESIDLACRAIAVQDGISWFLMEEKAKN